MAAGALPRPGLQTRMLGGSVKQLLDAQRRLLDRFVSTPMTPLRLELPSSGHTLNAVCSNGGQAIAPEEGRTVVLCHGLGAALGFFFNNIDSLLRKNGGHFDRVVAVDWLGFGASSRPHCAAPRNRWWSDFSLCKSKFDLAADGASGDAAAHFFLDTFDEFRREAGIEQFTLMGHSLGGYLSARYVVAYPEHLDQVVLVSPAGIFSPTDASEPVESPQVNSTPWMFRALDTAWSANVTPFQLIRLRGMLMQDGQAVVTNLLRRRFNNRFDQETTDLIAEYLWHTTALPGSGEYAMNSLLEPVFSNGRGGVYARRPIETLLERFPTDIDVLTVFGDHDWLAPAPKVAERFRATATTRGLRWGFGITPEAGHHLYLENPSHFNAMVRDFTA